jgi:7-cyano-7-deazaguanine reductase|tara:strand:+ start:22916 stop:23242 length:327 start_codon:yes stop_codon:yes gene_type:complete
MSTQLKTYPNPDSRKNWLIVVEIKEPVQLRVKMVPDKLIADHQEFKSLIRRVVGQDWGTPEEMTLNIIENINNDLVPMWLEVIYERDGIMVRLEDRQPGLADFQAPRN